jgi:hypothetical protein
MEKYLRIHGERHWRRQAITGIWRLDKEPEKSIKIPIRYTNSYGGEVFVPSENAEEGEQSLAREEGNPIGCGLLHKKHPDKIVKAPQIESIETPILNPYQTYAPQGFGFISRTWESRTEKAGTYDEQWLENQHPLPPLDFDPSFYQAAHPDLIYKSYFESGTLIELLNLLPDHTHQSFTLPKLQIVARYHLNTGVIEQFLNMDTIIVDIASDKKEEWSVFISWRNRHNIQENVQKSEILMVG